MRPLFPHKGRSRTGKRVHLVSDRGGAACLTPCELDVSPINAGPRVRPDQWCRGCLRTETEALDLEANMLLEDGTLLFAGAPFRSSGATWDAEAMVAVGGLILDYLDENPPSEGARFAEDFWNWGARLEHRGKQLLLELGGGDA
jgi:hypothetical protein